MSGQRKNYSVYKKQIEDHIKKHPPYALHEPCNIDLHALGRYLKEMGISNKDVTSDILEKFKL